MRIVKNSLLSRSATMAFSFLVLGGSAFAAAVTPEITAVVVAQDASGSFKKSAADDGSRRVHDTTTKIRISGTGFGEKVRGGPPILWDRVSSYRGIDGQYHYEGTSGDDPYQTGSVVVGSDERQPWSQASYAGLYGKEDNAVYVKKEGEELEVKVIGDAVVRRVVGQRSSDEPAHYVINGPQGFIGKPREYGGRNPPAGSDYLYVSWWIKFKHHPVLASNYTLVHEKGAFRPGDKFLIEGTAFGGEILGFPKGDNFAAVVLSDKAAVSSKSVGKKIVKVNSDGVIISGDNGAVATLSAPYEPDGHNKFIRVWDNPDGKNFRLSWTQVAMSAVAVDGSKTDDKSWFTWTGVAKQWNHMELEIDLNKETARAWVNNDLFATISLKNTARDKNFSPTIGLMGWDGQFQYYQLTEFGDIYVDNSLQRVVIASKPTWAEASVSPAAYKGVGPEPRLKEVQYPTSWSDTQIDAEIYIGGYDECGVDGLFLYVSNKDGVFNEKGYKLGGIACPAAPKIL